MTHIAISCASLLPHAAAALQPLPPTQQQEEELSATYNFAEAKKGDIQLYAEERRPHADVRREGAPCRGVGVRLVPSAVLPCTRCWRSEQRRVTVLTHWLALCHYVVQWRVP